MEVAGGGAAVVVGASSPRRVVVAVDESEESMHALSWCLSNVAAVVLVHARSPRPFYYPCIDGAGEMTTMILLLLLLLLLLGVCSCSSLIEHL